MWCGEKSGARYGMVWREVRSQVWCGVARSPEPGVVWCGEKSGARCGVARSPEPGVVLRGEKSGARCGVARSSGLSGCQLGIPATQHPSQHSSGGNRRRTGRKLVPLVTPQHIAESAAGQSIGPECATERRRSSAGNVQTQHIARSAESDLQHSLQAKTSQPSSKHHLAVRAAARNHSRRKDCRGMATRHRFPASRPNCLLRYCAVQ